MTEGRTPTAAQLIIRSLLPSAISAALCICFGIVVVAVNLLLLSLTAGTSLPRLLDGQWALMYTNYVVGPTERVINNFTVNNILVIVLWGVIGLCVYGLSSYGIHLFWEWWHAEHDIKIGAQGHIVPHPLRHAFIITILWRLSVLCITVAGFVGMQPVSERVLRIGPNIILGNPTLTTALFQLGIAIFTWTFLAHCFVVLARLFLMRTRLFGDPEIT
jgi:hypothetical protein